MRLLSVITLCVITSGFASVSSVSKADLLSDKLEHQWRLYDQTRAQALSHLQSPIAREEWEKLLALPPKEAFTAADLNDLKASQTLRIAAAKTAAQKSSLFDLDLVRSQNSEVPFCAALPKGGMLHIHPFGTLDRPTARTLLEKSNPVLDIQGALANIDATNGNATVLPAERSWLNSITPKVQFDDLMTDDQIHFENFLFLPPGKQSFSRFNAVFEFLGFAIPDYSSYETVLRAFADKAVREHVRYVEFTTGVSPDLLQMISRLETATGLKIRLNNAFVRTESVEQLTQDWKSFLASPIGDNLVGIDFLDNEDGNPALEKGGALYASALAASLAGKRIHRTMHAGEIGDVRNPRDAMILGAERLGHGVNLGKDPVALEYAAKIHEPVEINLSSNLRLTDVTAIETHPYLNFLRLGLPVSLSTDDEGIFDIDINHECEVAIAHSDVTYAELKEMAMNSIRTSFSNEADKQALLRDLGADFLNFESSAQLAAYRKSIAR